MTSLAPADYLQHLRTESRRFREVLATCDPAARVPGCPDWDAADLLWHLAGVQWFWAQTVRTRPAPASEEAPRPERPETYDGLLAAFDEYSASLVSELERADPTDEAWTWSTEQTVGFTFRRQAHEAMVHRLDAEQAAGEVTPFDPALAADGVLECLDVMFGGAPPWGGGAPPAPPRRRRRPPTSPAHSACGQEPGTAGRRSGTFCRPQPVAPCTHRTD